MRAVIQRVSHASVKVNGETTGKCDKGFLILLCVMENDTEADIQTMSSKIAKLRIFEDENGRINKSLADVGGEVLVISQFTLAADCRHGNRPDFFSAAPPEKAKKFFDLFVSDIRNYVPHTETGIFGEHMDVSLCNDGPFTIVMDTDNMKKKK